VIPTLQIIVSNETAPPGGMAQFKISLASPATISSGTIAMDFDASAFGAIAGATAFSAFSDQWGMATVQGLHLNAQFNSPSGGITAPVSLAVSTRSGGNWLSAKLNHGAGVPTFSVSVTPAGLPPGTYKGNVTLSASGAAPAQLPVTLTVWSMAPPLVVTPSSLLFTVPDHYSLQ
jgi:hypothetical protein